MGSRYNKESLDELVGDKDISAWVHILQQKSQIIEGKLAIWRHYRMKS